MIRVVCAIIENEEGKVLVCQRSESMAHPLKWEFPGGKIQKDESEVNAIKREIEEELKLKIRTKFALDPVPHDYGNKQVVLVPYVCFVVSGVVELVEHAAAKWVEPRDLGELDWVGADVGVVEGYLGLFG